MNDDTSAFLTTGVIVWLVVAVFGLMITATCWQTGRGPDEHPGPVPVGVKQLSRINYLVNPATAKVNPGQLCVNSSGNPSVNDVEWQNLSVGIFVECNHPQSWNDHRPIALSWGNALLQRTVVNPIVDGVLGFLLLLCLAPGVGEGVSNGWRRRKARKRLKTDIEGRQDVLAQSFARDKISEAEFERGLDRINEELLR